MTTGIWEQRGTTSYMPRLAALALWVRAERAAPLAAGAVLSAAAGIAHAAAVRAHVQDWPFAGAFFVLVAAAQCAYAVVLLRDPSRRFHTAGAAGTLGLLALYAGSRTIGIPFGPHPFEPEPIGALDLFAAATEIALLFVLARLYGRQGSPERAPLRHAGRLVTVTLALAMGAGATAGASPVAGHHGARAGGPESGHRIVAGDHDDDEPLEHFEQEDRHAARRAPGHRSSEHDGLDEECVPSAGTPVTLTENTDPARLTALAYTDHSEDHGGLVVYDAARDDVTTVLTGECWYGRRPRFKDPETLSFEADGWLYTVDLPTGAVTKLDLPRYVDLYEWNADGSTLAFTAWEGEQQSSVLQTLDVASGEIRVLREIGEPEGRCGWEGDEGRIQWSPDGSALILTETWMASEHTLFVVDLQGKDLIEPRDGTFGRWLADSGSIIYAALDEVERRWRIVDVATDDERTLAVPDWRFDPVLSPDGTTLAYNTGGESPRITLLDVSTGEERVVADGYYAAQWSDSGSLLASAVGDCGEWGCHGQWAMSDRVDRIGIASGAASEVAANTTWDVGTLYGTPGPAVPEQHDLGAPAFEPRDDVEVTPLQEAAFDVRAIDPERARLTYTAARLPEGATFDAGSRLFRWMPGVDDAGTYTVTFTATDRDGLTATQTITIEVTLSPDAVACATAGACANSLPQYRSSSAPMPPARTGGRY